ncbi:multicopper oxidase domain-containing protein [Clostridium tertium]|uniref:Spore coat protein A n=1 Tax=Clostridium tertium TaxID=1559 RepID=A0A6N3G3A3_9CLOT
MNKNEISGELSEEINEEVKKNHEGNSVNPSDPNTIPKFIDKLPVPKVEKPILGIDESGQERLMYRITMRESQHYFSSYFPKTKIWGYNGLCPGPTIEAFKNIPTYVLWENQLPKSHFLPYDRTLHGTVDDPEVKTVVHLHGAKVDSSSDGHPEAWFTRNFKIVGPTFSRKIYKYDNYQSGTTLWYHDHAMGQTRLNVYAGLAGAYILRDDLEERLNLPKGEYEIPLLIQDKSFKEDGELFYPDRPPFPVDTFPSIVPGFFGNTIVVNGKIWPYLDVEPRKYRFRLINASNRREYILRLSNGAEFIQIGTDGGLIEMPNPIDSFKIMPSERIDLIIDFSKYKGEEITLMNDDVSAPTPGTDMIMKFNVVKSLEGEDESTIPETLRIDHGPNIDAVSKKRRVSFGVETDHYGRPMLLIDNMTWTDPTTEDVEFDSVEIWNLINPMFGGHPIHIHLVQFKLLWRRPFDVECYNDTGKVMFTGEEEPPKDYEKGFKDTIDAEPGKVTRIIMQFKGYSGDYVWHCHFLEHEDHEMMRPLKVSKCCNKDK